MYSYSRTLKNGNRQNRSVPNSELHSSWIRTLRFYCIWFDCIQNIAIEPNVFCFVHKRLLHFVRWRTHCALVNTHLLWENVLPIDKLSQSHRVCSPNWIITANIFISSRNSVNFFILFFSHNDIDGGWLKQTQLTVERK